MTDWIKDFKTRSESAAANRRMEQQFQLEQNAKLKARLPVLWENVTRQVESQATELGKAMPDNDACATEFKEIDNGFVLSQTRCAHRSISAVLNPHGLLIDVQDRDANSPHAIPSQVPFHLNSKDEACLTWHELQAESDPARIAEHVVRLVCGIT